MHTYIITLQFFSKVYFAGDIHSAKEEVQALIRLMGFTPVDKGALRAARDIEDIPVQRFPSWKKPVIISSVIFAILFILAFTKYDFNYHLHQIPLFGQKQ